MDKKGAVLEHLANCSKRAKCQTNKTWAFVRTDVVDDALELLQSDSAIVKIYHDNGITSWCVCGRCSTTVSKGDKFCHECGRQLQWNG